MGIFSSLKRDQKEAVGLLQVGTFLEYFDLMLYVHMAVLLNGLFFPETDPHTAALLSAFAFCSTYVLRPFGALLFGYIGDHIGRKATVIITTMMMAISCIIMAILPTYAQIGITSAWIMILCRMLQGLSSMGEITGAEIYLTEVTRPPARYPIVALIGCASRVGTMMALGAATLITAGSLNWRNAFWIGAAIAVVGSVARTHLRETPDFVDMQRRLKKATEDSERNISEKAVELLKSTNSLWKETVQWKISLAFFLISSGPPVCLYFSYIYCGNILKTMGYSGEFIISQHFMVSIIELLGLLLITFLSYKIYPLKILKIKSILFFLFLCFFPYMIYTAHTSSDVFIIQAMSVCFTLTGVPAVAALVVHFPILRRFTYSTFIYALSRTLMYVIISFGAIYLTEFFGYWGILFIMAPITVGFLWGTLYFDKLERTSKNSDLSRSLEREDKKDMKVYYRKNIAVAY